MQARMVDVFTQTAGLGNPAAVVIQEGPLTAPEMAAIAVQLGVETTFVDGATLRYYLPDGQPMTLCGHGTVAALAVMGRPGRFTLSSPAGPLKVSVEPYLIGVGMPPVTFRDPIEPERAAKALGIPIDAIDGPVQPAGAGRPKLMVPLRSVETLDAILPTKAIGELCAELDVTGIYPFTLNARSFGVLADARQFPASGLIEDPVTGTAAVALAWYLWHHGAAPGCGSLKIEQGHAMGRPGMIMIKQEPGGLTWIYGQTVLGGIIDL
jgi:trans-2,3-dihydro-3-hydroxyanthranilate isomerase